MQRLVIFSFLNFMPILKIRMATAVTVDVAKEVIKLKEQKVDGIVIDLRNNGGGSLYDVVQMAGLFIEDGPIVQVKDRDGKPSVLT